MSMMTHGSHTHVPDETQRRGQAFLRTLPILLIPFLVAALMGIIFRVLYGPPSIVTRQAPPFSPLIPIFIIGIFFIALIALARLGRPNISSVLLIGVWTLITTLLGLTIESNNFWPALLLVPICAAGLLLDGVASITLAALATVLVGGVGLFNLQQAPLPSDISQFDPETSPLVLTTFWIGIFWTIAALTFLLASSMQRALKATRAQAEQLRELAASLDARVQEQTSELLEQSRETAVMEERARVARDIHDTLAQDLTGIVVQLGAAQRAMEVAAQDAAEPNDTRDHIQRAQDMAREALAEARRSIWNLRAANLERGELRDALAGLAQRASNENTRVTFETRGEEWALRAEVESALLRVAQEALVNVGKHANAAQATLVLEYCADAVQLIIHDNGIGLDDDALNDVDAIKNSASGFGLMGMRERIEQWGGTLELTNAGGAKVVAPIPRARAERVGELEQPRIYANLRES